MTSRVSVFGTAVVAATLSACGGSGGGESTGTVSVAVSDSAIHDATKVCVEFTEIELKHSDETIVVVPDGVTNINLLDYQGQNAAPLLIDETVPAGEYQWMRLKVNAELGGTGGTGNPAGPDCAEGGSYLEAGDAVYNLYVPSGAQSGLKLNRGFTVAAGGSADFTIEFDMQKSLTDPVGLAPDVILRPSLRLVNNLEVGALQGVVSADLATAAECQPSVYVFGDGVEPNAITTDETDPDDPIATAMVSLDENDEWRYAVGFLEAGDYEAAFTCDDGATFEPAAGKGVSIEVGATTELDFL